LIVHSENWRGQTASVRGATGIYADEVLQHYFPPAMAVISNIAAG
jgi:hypothetical protein